MLIWVLYLHRVPSLVCLFKIGLIIVTCTSTNSFFPLYSLSRKICFVSLLKVLEIFQFCFHIILYFRILRNHL